MVQETCCDFWFGSPAKLSALFTVQEHIHRRIFDKKIKNSHFELVDRVWRPTSGNP